MKKILIAATTIDGKIAKNHFHNTDWTSKKDKTFFRQKVKNAGVVIFGANTYKAMGKFIPDVLNIIMTGHTHKFKHMEIKNRLEFTSNTPKKIIEKLEKKGFKKVVIGGGSEIYSLFLRNNLIDFMYITISPKVFGKGISLFSPKVGPTELTLLETSKLGKNEILLKYKLT